jgi:molybdate transport system permease protein
MAKQITRKPDSSRLNLGLSLLAFFGFLLLAMPVFALLTRVPWSSFFEIASTEGVQLALRVSVITSLISAVISVLLGVPLAWYLARGPQEKTRWIRPIVIAPLVMPPTVSGIALLTLMGRNGIVGKYVYETTGYSMPFTTTAVIVSGIFVGMPFLVLVLESAFRQTSIEVEEAAATLGAPPVKVFWRISLPLAKSGLIAGAVLAWARALGEFGATLMFAGSLPGITRTMPMAVYSAMESDQGSALVVSAILLTVAILVVFFLRSNLIKTFSR